MRILSWNVNGIRACARKGFLDWLGKDLPDILCCQETKARPEQVADYIDRPSGYYSFWNPAERKGYSGVVTFSQKKPDSVKTSFGTKRFDNEGRILITEYPGFVLYNIYFPNGKKDAERLKYKLAFYDAFLEHLDREKAKGKKLIICGDYNTAHKEIDLAHPRQNAKISGFLPIERAWMDKLVEHGFIDTFRMFHPEPNQYTWWSFLTRARKRNVGWRIDYFFVSDNLKKNVKDAFIRPEVMGSDHCPVGILLKVPG
ncbi:exodeoxyribonuclease III [candidate division WOR-3 bacterium JGI_Cruoil_03_51_56]|uniref:Exodeoxyribonuclease III n=1 Tax=candidate division WOR-3 bacterium JGI_Cruoil_03_51_56 TaxID=1973747 RepID=A0A235BWG8_UNCW3|nr:MAG: exodeoxyribonuclease III [candidate division WOR-3 bacterium JGI_Cruoil_03_51_56]